MPTRAARMSPKARRKQLLEAAIRTFADLGIGESSHTALAAQAGVALPTVFHYFATKEEIIDATLCEVSRFLLDELLRPNDNPAHSAPASIENVLIAFCDAIETHPDYVRVWLEWSVALREGLREPYLEFYQKALAGIRRILDRGIAESSIRNDVELDDAARVIVGLAHMIVQMKLSGAGRDQVEHTVHSLVHGYLQRSGVQNC